MGEVVRVDHRAGNLRFAIRAPLRLSPGASLAVDGVCLTIVEVKGEILWVEAIEPTVCSTSLRAYRAGRWVNLEPALNIETPLGGHLVTGHVDGVGSLAKIVPHPGYSEFWVRTGPEAKDFLLPRASVAVDGISLTIAQAHSAQFSTNIIPHTLKSTSLGRKRVGELVNLEFDYIAKWLKRTR